MKDLKIFMLAILALLVVSCQKETVDDDGIVRLRVSLSAEEISRAGENAQPTRYVMEVYKQGETGECLSHQEFDHSTFDVSLPPGTFDLYFWADYGGYTVDNLTAVSLNEEVQSDGDCFAGAQKGVNLYEEENSLAVTLKRPVACIRYADKDGGEVPAGGTVSATYLSLHTVYNVITGMVSGEPVSVTRTLSPLSSGDYFAADYVFVSGEEEALDINLTVGKDEQKMTGITVKPNVVTRIQGDFIK